MFFTLILLSILNSYSKNYNSNFNIILHDSTDKYNKTTIYSYTKYDLNKIAIIEINETNNKETPFDIFTTIAPSNNVVATSYDNSAYNNATIIPIIDNLSVFLHYKQENKINIRLDISSFQSNEKTCLQTINIYKNYKNKRLISKKIEITYTYETPYIETYDYETLAQQENSDLNITMPTPNNKQDRIQPYIFSISKNF